MRTLVARVILGANLLDFAGLEEPQEQALHPEGHLPYFVEEYRAVVGHLQLAGLVAIGAGKTALHVAEELRFEQGLRYARAVDRHERLSPAAAVVDGPCHNFLARPALAGDEHLGVGSRDAADFGA
jgi:hypothetical protein